VINEPRNVVGPIARQIVECDRRGGKGKLDSTPGREDEGDMWLRLTEAHTRLSTLVNFGRVLKVQRLSSESITRLYLKEGDETPVICVLQTLNQIHDVLWRDESWIRLTDAHVELPTLVNLGRVVKIQQVPSENLTRLYLEEGDDKQVIKVSETLVQIYDVLRGREERRPPSA
jgi:hypothetical protein